MLITPRFQRQTLSATVERMLHKWNLLISSVWFHSHENLTGRISSGFFRGHQSSATNSTSPPGVETFIRTRHQMCKPRMITAQRVEADPSRVLVQERPPIRVPRLNPTSQSVHSCPVPSLCVCLACSCVHRSVCPTAESAASRQRQLAALDPHTLSQEEPINRDNVVIGVGKPGLGPCALGPKSG